jgi:hypothetical protein
MPVPGQLRGHENLLLISLAKVDPHSPSSRQTFAGLFVISIGKIIAKIKSLSQNKKLSPFALDFPNRNGDFCVYKMERFLPRADNGGG